MIRDLLLSIVLALVLTSCNKPVSSYETILPSPDLKTHLYFNLNEGEPYYLVYYENNILIDWSLLGFTIDDTINFYEGLLVNNVESRSASQGNEDSFPDIDLQLNTFNEITVHLSKTSCPDIQLSIVLRVYNNAAAFKYIFNQINDNRRVKEITELDLYNTVEIKNDTISIPYAFVSSEGYKIEYLQSVVQDYPSMKLATRTRGGDEYRMIFASDDQQAVSVSSGFETPWRIIHFTDNLKLSK